MQKKVTIIIPNYNGLKFMEPCFKALRAQSDQNFELLVVDNGSTDGSVKWLEDHQIPSIFLEENTGFPVQSTSDPGIRDSLCHTAKQRYRASAGLRKRDGKSHRAIPQNIFRQQ